ncbi:MAG: hypothetical protein ACN6PH_03085 [Pseudomonas sp.]
MAVEEKVLEALLKNGTMDEEEQKVRGIAQLAVDRGFDALSAAQQRVLEPFLSTPCSGVEDPGGYHNECPRDLEGEDLVEAIEQSVFYGSVLCENCRDETDRYANEWARIQAE